MFFCDIHIYWTRIGNTGLGKKIYKYKNRIFRCGGTPFIREVEDDRCNATTGCMHAPYAMHMQLESSLPRQVLLCNVLHENRAMYGDQKLMESCGVRNIVQPCEHKTPPTRTGPVCVYNDGTLNRSHIIAIYVWHSLQVLAYVSTCAARVLKMCVYIYCTQQVDLIDIVLETPLRAYMLLVSLLYLRNNIVLGGPWATTTTWWELVWMCLWNTASQMMNVAETIRVLTASSGSFTWAGGNFTGGRIYNQYWAGVWRHWIAVCWIHLYCMCDLFVCIQLYTFEKRPCSLVNHLPT